MGGGEVEEGGEVGEMMKQCRICHEYGDEGGDMDVPCACNGTIKFAHKICIQRWCNIKGDIVCEICNQVYTPNYIVQPIRSTPDAVTIDIDNSAAAHQELFHEEYEAADNTGTAWRFMAFIVMVIFFIHNLLMAAKECGLVKEPSQQFNIFLQLAGLALPCYIIAQSCYMLQSHRRQQHMF